MKYRLLSDTGVFVSEICLGAMTFGGQSGVWQMIGGLDQKAVDVIVHRAIDAGVNFVDTANVYSAGESETLLGKAIAGRLACRRRRILARQSSHIAGKAGSVDLPLPTDRPGGLDVTGIDQAPHRIRAHPKQVGSLPDPEMASHRETIANAQSGEPK